MNIDAIIAYEQGELDPQGVIELFAEGIKTGMVWQLQGHYGRTAKALIQNGLISRDGTINQELFDELMESA